MRENRGRLAEKQQHAPLLLAQLLATLKVWIALEELEFALE